MEDLYGTFYTYFLAVSRWLLPLLSVAFVLQWIRCFRRLKQSAKPLAAFVTEDGDRLPVTSWEASIGRRGVSDIVINLPNISRKHAVLSKTDDGFRISDTESSGGITVNGEAVNGSAELQIGDKVELSGFAMRLVNPISEDYEEHKQKKVKTKRQTRSTDGLMLLFVSLIQVIMLLQLCLRFYEDLPMALPISFAVLLLGEWVCYFVNHARSNRPQLPEMICFFLLTFGFAVFSTASPGTVYKQVGAAAAGFILFIILTLILKNLKLTMKLRYAVGGGALVLLAANLILAQATNGAKNWINLGFMTIQPSEFVKIAFIFAGAATLERLLTKHNLMFFLGFSGACLLALVLMNDFGGMAIFFVTMMLIIFIRSGDTKTLFMLGGISAFAVIAAAVVIQFVPHISKRFAAWRHVWQYAADKGFQQTRTMVGIGSGGLLGVGGGNGYVDRVFAADTDLVFGILFEEWGGIIAMCVVACFVLLALYAFKLSKNSKSAYYAIAVCAAATMMLLQVALNVFGSTDILPLTGVTMPFVSNGGSSMMASFGLLAFFRVAEERSTLMVLRN